MAPTDVSGGVPTAEQLDGISYVMPPMGQLESLGIDGTAFSYGEMVGLAAALGSTTSPWLTVGMAWPDSDYQRFGSQLCKWEGSHNFPAIYVECNNENWNGGQGRYFKTPIALQHTGWPVREHSTKRPPSAAIRESTTCSIIRPGIAV